MIPSKFFERIESYYSDLLDMILLLSDVESFKANPKGQTVGTVIESHISRGQGPVATVIIQNGTLRAGDFG